MRMRSSREAHSIPPGIRRAIFAFVLIGAFAILAGVTHRDWRFALFWAVLYIGVVEWAGLVVWAQGEIERFAGPLVGVLIVVGGVATRDWAVVTLAVAVYLILVTARMIAAARALARKEAATEKIAEDLDALLEEQEWYFNLTRMMAEGRLMNEINRLRNLVPEEDRLPPEERGPGAGEAEDGAAGPGEADG